MRVSIFSIRADQWYLQPKQLNLIEVERRLLLQEYYTFYMFFGILVVIKIIIFYLHSYIFLDCDWLNIYFVSYSHQQNKNLKRYVLRQRKLSFQTHQPA